MILSAQKKGRPEGRSFFARSCAAAAAMVGWSLYFRKGRGDAPAEESYDSKRKSL